MQIERFSRNFTMEFSFFSCFPSQKALSILLAGGDLPIQVFFTAGHSALLGGVGGTGGGPRGGHGAQPQKHPFSAPVRGLPGSKGLRSSRVSGRPGGMALIRKYGIMMKRQERRAKTIEDGGLRMIGVG